MWFYGECYESHGLQRNQWKQIQEADTTVSLTNRICKHQATFFGLMMRREKLEHLVTTGMINGNHSRGKQQEKILD